MAGRVADCRVSCEAVLSASRGRSLYATKYTVMNMHWVYVLECRDDKSWYIGMTHNLKRRLKEHHSGTGSRTTSLKRNWHPIYCEGYINRLDAEGRERFLKSGSGRTFLKKQMRNYLQNS